MLDDWELKAIDALIDDRVVNRVLAPESFTPSMRHVYPCHYLRAELLKSLCYPEFSYRKYCDKVLNQLDKKKERAFVRLPLHKKICIHHTHMSAFRNGVSVAQLMNLMVYVSYLLIKKAR